MFLSDKVGEQHCRGVSGEPSPCACHVAVVRYEDDVYKYEHHASGTREPRAPDGLVDEFVPERQVEIHSHHYLGSHHDGHNFQSAPVVAPYEVAQDVHIAHDDEECQQGEDDEILHCLGIGGAVVLVFRLSEDEGLVGVTERLGYHCHYHGYLELCVRVSVLVYVGEENLVCCLVENARDAEHEYRPAV